MNHDDQPPAPEPLASVPPPGPPHDTIVGAAAGDGDSGRLTKPDYGCHVALSVLAKRYKESDIHGAYAALVEEEQLLREHIDFPSYKFQLGVTMARRSEIESHLGDAEAASATLAEAHSVCAEALSRGKPTAALALEVVLKSIRELEKEQNVKWRQNVHAA